MKRNFFVLMSVLGVLICLILIPQTASADASGTFGENISWNIDVYGELTISGYGDMPEVASAEEIPWYNYKMSVDEVVIGNGITNICIYAFLGCENLEKVSIPYGVKSIGGQAFYGNRSLIQIEIPNSVEVIGRNAFAGCRNMKSVTFSDGLKSIGDYAFYYCPMLESVVIPDTVTQIGERAFGQCGSLKEITLPFVGTELYPANIQDGKLCQIFDGKSEQFQYTSLPESLKKVTVTNQEIIPEGAFADSCYIEEITIGSKTKEISRAAFSHCLNLKTINISNDNCQIGDEAFSLCNNLTTVDLPDNMKTIPDLLFSHCKKLSEIIIPEGVESIGEYAFYRCYELSNINIPDNVSSIGNRAFAECEKLNNINIPDSIKTIGDFAFAECLEFEELYIPDSVTYIGNGAFKGCNNITEITLPFVGSSDDATGESAVFGYIFGFGDEYLSENCARQFYSASENHCYFVPDSLKKVTITNDTGLHYGAFDDCRKITEIILPDTLQTIGDYVFYECDGLEEIIIPEGVVSIGKKVFQYCDNLSEVTFYSKEIDIADSCFDGSNVVKIKGYFNSDVETFARANDFEFIPLAPLPDSEKKVQDISVSEITNAIYGDEVITVMVTPDGTSQLTDFTFESSNTGVAEISTEGIITIKAAGETDITVKQAGNYEYAAFEKTQKLTVAKKNVVVTSVDLENKTAVLDGVLVTDTVVALDFDKVNVEVVEAIDEITSKVLVSNFVLKGEKSENYVVTSESAESVIITDNLVTLTITATDGTATGAGTYIKGSSVTVVATPNNGYTFKGWYLSDKSVSTKATYTFVLNENTELVAKFTKKSTGGGGGGGGGSGSVVKPPLKEEDNKQEETKSEPSVTPDKPSVEIKFNDVNENDWYFEYVKELAEKGIISGIGNGDFAPNDKVTREQFLKMIIEATDIEVAEAENTFDDVADEWYKSYVLKAKKLGIVNGVTDTKFGIGNNITRQDMAVMISRTINKLDVRLNTNEVEIFADNAYVSDYAKEAVTYIKSIGLIEGYNNEFRPLDNLTRAEAAKVISELLKLL